MLELLSLALGFAAWGFGLGGLWKKKDLSLPSLGLCCLSLMTQLAVLRHYGIIEDASAFYDTIHARFLAGAVLVTVTLALNGAAWWRQKKREHGENV